MTNTVPQVPYTPPAVTARQPVAGLMSVKGSDLGAPISAHFEK
jgi:hypothetical protein